MEAPFQHRGRLEVVRMEIQFQVTIDLFFLPIRTAALQQMPRSRYYQIRRMYQLLANQSEDCLYLNVFVPPEGRRLSTEMSTQFNL